MQQDYASDGTHRDSATDYLYASTTNDLIKKTQYGEVTGNADGTFTDIGTDKRIASTTYAASSSVNLTVPIEATVLDSNSATSSDQKLYYDGLPFGQVSLGNLTKQEELDQHYHLCQLDQDVQCLWPRRHLDRPPRLCHRLSNTTRSISTLPPPPIRSTSRRNTSTTTPTANRSRRPIPTTALAKISTTASAASSKSINPDVSTPSLLATSTTYQYTDNTATPSIIHRADYLTATNTVDTYDYYDGLNRLVQERKASQTAGTYVAADRLYNPVGLLGSTSLPYFSSGSGFTSPTSITALYTAYTYDALKRVLITSNAVGSTKNVYAKWTTTTTDPNGNVKDYVLDAFGNLATCRRAYRRHACDHDVHLRRRQQSRHHHR